MTDPTRTLGYVFTHDDPTNPVTRKAVHGTHPNQEIAMNDATLRSFREIAAAMAGDIPMDWEWVGPYASQRMFGITQARAEAFAERHGGTARKMVAEGDGDSGEQELSGFRFGSFSPRYPR